MAYAVAVSKHQKDCEALLGCRPTAGRLAKNMKFLVIERAVIPTPHANMKERLKVVTAHYDYLADLQKKGKVLHHSWVGFPGGVSIFDVKDNYELDLLVAGAPRYPYCNYEIQPLLTLEDARKCLDLMKAKEGE